MTLSPVSVETFGGLNLLNDPEEIGWSGAIDLLNVDFDQRGRVRSRYGTHAVNAAAANAYRGLERATDTQLLAARHNGVTTWTAELVAYTGTVTAVGTWTANSTVFSSCPFGTPTATTVYIASGSNSSRGTLQKVNPLAPSIAASVGKPWYVGVYPVSNRLVQAGFDAAADPPTGANGSASSVFFSDAGLPETYSANNFVQLTPGDTESITGLATWHNLLFVFKETKFFVFYGTSTDSSGNPVFNYRSVVGGFPRIWAGNGQAMAVGRDGVYFMTREGVWKTSGDAPVPVSRPVDPILVGSPPSTFGGEARVDNTPALSWSARRLYVTYGSSGGNRTLVYDEELDAWMYWDIGAFNVLSFYNSISPVREVPFYVDQTTSVRRMRSDLTTDAGTNITSRYRTGFSDLSSPDMKTIREWQLEGIGSPTFKTSHDFGSLETGAAVTLGVSPAVLEARRRFAVRGRHFSWQVGATSAWSLNNLVAHVREKRAAGVHSAT